MTEGHQRRLLFCYFLLVSAAACELLIPVVLWVNRTVGVVVSSFLIAGLVGSFVRSGILRMLGWIGILMFTLLVFGDSFFYELHAASISRQGPPAPPRSNSFDWTLLAVWIQNILLVICFKEVNEHSASSSQVGQLEKGKSKRFYILLGYVLTALSSAFLMHQLDTFPSGKIDIEYAGMSAIGVDWTLDNFSTHPIYVLMDGDEVFPPNATTKCRMNDSDVVSSEKLSPLNASMRHAKVVSGERVRFNVTTSLPHKFTGGHCLLRLELEGGTFVESAEFTPK